MSQAVAIVDSGGANIASLLHAFRRLDCPAELTTSAAIIEAAPKVVLPGVGAARDAMARLRENGLIDVIRGLKQPVIGICLGMQLLADASEEEDVDCLGIIPGVARKLSGTADCPVPNMGWCRVSRTAAHPVTDGIKDGSWFYFLHSYALPVAKNTVLSADHAEPFSAAMMHDNFLAAQFHPERSASSGSHLLMRFLEWQP